MSNTVTTDIDPSAFQIPGMNQGPEYDPTAGLGQEYGTNPSNENIQGDDFLDLYGEVTDNASSLFAAEDAREEALSAAIPAYQVEWKPKPVVNTMEILRFTTNAGRELRTWRHLSVNAQDPDFIDALRAKAKNGRF